MEQWKGFSSIIDRISPTWDAPSLYIQPEHEPSARKQEECAEGEASSVPPCRRRAAAAQPAVEEGVHGVVLHLGVGR